MDAECIWHLGTKENANQCKLIGDEPHLVAITLLIESSKGTNDGEEHCTQTSQQEVKRARRGTEGPEEDGDNEDLEGNGKSNDDEDYDDHLATKRQGVTKEEATAPP